MIFNTMKMKPGHFGERKINGGGSFISVDALGSTRM